MFTSGLCEAQQDSVTINGIHLDDNTENYTIEDNVFMNCDRSHIR